MKKYSNIIHLAFLVLILCFCSCIKIENNEQDKNTIYGSGGLTTHNLSIDSFSKINLTGQAKITVVKGDTQSVAVRAQQNIFDVLDIHSSSSNLFIGVKDNYSINTQEGIFVDIVSPTAITDVSIVGSGDLIISGSNQESFNVSITGAGNFSAYGLDVDNADINISGAAVCSVKVNKTLTIIISGAGTVKYKGNPSISQSIAGVGSVINEN
jgi:hypothetical protein